MRRHLLSLQPLAALVFTSACSVGSFTGKVAGVGFTPKDAVYGYAQYTSSHPDLPSNLGIAIVALTSTAGACDDLANGIDRQSSEAAYFTLLSIQGTAVALPKGDFPLSYADGTDPNSIHNIGYANFDPIDPNCQTLPAFWDAIHGTYSAAAIASTGTIKITDASKDSLAANFDLTFGTTDKVSGSFDATSCSTLKDAVDQLAALEGFDVSSSSTSSSNGTGTVTRTCKP